MYLPWEVSNTNLARKMKVWETSILNLEIQTNLIFYAIWVEIAYIVQRQGKGTSCTVTTYRIYVACESTMVLRLYVYQIRLLREITPPFLSLQIIPRLFCYLLPSFSTLYLFKGNLIPLLCALFVCFLFISNVTENSWLTKFT